MKSLSLFLSRSLKQLDQLNLFRQRTLTVGGRLTVRLVSSLGNKTGFDQKENTCMEKYHCMADLQFHWFGFNQTGKSVVNLTFAKQQPKS